MEVAAWLHPSQVLAAGVGAVLLVLLYPFICRLLGRGRKLRAGCLPLRVSPGGNLQLMLVTSRRTPEWYTFPAGGIERGESCAEAAARETREEAGAVGRIGRLVSKADSTKMYALWVEAELDRWPEQRERKRRWFDLGVPGTPGSASSIDGVRSCLTPKPSQQRVLRACERIVAELVKDGESNETQWGRPARTRRSARAAAE